MFARVTPYGESGCKITTISPNRQIFAVFFVFVADGNGPNDSCNTLIREYGDTTFLAGSNKKIKGYWL